MAQATTVGSLLVSLGMDSTQFQREATKAQSKTAAIAQSFNITGKQVYEASQRMGVSVAGFASAMQGLQARVNPAAAALDRYRREATLLKEAMRAGVITQEQFNTSLRQSIQVYRETSRSVVGANDNVQNSAGNMQAGMQQLGYQISDVAAMWGSGSKPMQIFASQAGQVTQAVALMTGGAGKFGAFMTGPWGAAITAGVVVLGTLFSRLDDVESKFDDVRAAAKDAMEELRNSMNRVSAMTDAVDKSAKSRVEALGVLARVNRQIAQAESNMSVLGRTFGGGEAAEAEQQRLAILYRQRQSAQKQLNEANKDLSNAAIAADVLARQRAAQNANDTNSDRGGSPRSGGGGRASGAQRSDTQLVDLSVYDEEILRARLSLATTAEARAELEGQLLNVEKSQRFAEVNADKRLTDAQKAAQKAKLETLYGPETPDAGEITVGNGLAYQIQQRQQAEDALRMAQDSRARQIEALDAMAAINPSLRARAKLEAQALDLQQQTERDLLDQQIANGQIADADKERAALATKQAAQREGLARQHMTPMEQYRFNLQSSVANINDAMENIQVNAMESLNSQLAEALVNFDNLGKVAQNVFKQMLADIIRLQLQKNLTSGFNSILGSIGKVFGAGMGAPIDVSALANNTLSPMNFGLAGARANGGPIRAGLPYLVGERGPEIVVPGSSGQVIPNHELSQMRGAQVQVIPSPYFDVVVQQQAAGVAGPMAVASGANARMGATADVSRAARRKIPGR